MAVYISKLAKPLYPEWERLTRGLVPYWGGPGEYRLAFNEMAALATIQYGLFGSCV
jgi:hypothetical protein